MRRAYFGLGVFALLAFGLVRCWHGTTRISKATAPEANPVEADSTSSPVLRTAATVSNEGPAGEEPFIRRLHKLHVTRPNLAVSLAREDRQRNPQSPDAEERDMVLVVALYNARDILGAKSEAWYYFVHYPNGKFTDYLSKLTRLEPPKTRLPE